jgi:hypothetical protein
MKLFYHVCFGTSEAVFITFSLKTGKLLLCHFCFCRVKYFLPILANYFFTTFVLTRVNYFFTTFSCKSGELLFATFVLTLWNTFDHLKTGELFFATLTIETGQLLLLNLFWNHCPRPYLKSYNVLQACLNLFIGIITTIVVFVLENFDDEELKQVRLGPVWACKMRAQAFVGLALPGMWTWGLDCGLRQISRPVRARALGLCSKSLSLSRP